MGIGAGSSPYVYYWDARNKNSLVRALEGKVVRVNGTEYVVEDGCILALERFDLSQWPKWELLDLLETTRVY